MDRPTRPLFPEGFGSDTQVIATVLSSDKENDPDMLALTGATAALHISDIPWGGPVAAVRVGRVNGESLLIYPTFEQQAESDIDLDRRLLEGRDRDGRGRRRRGDRDRRHRRAHVRAQGGAADPRAHRELRAAVGKPKRDVRDARRATRPLEATVQELARPEARERRSSRGQEGALRGAATRRSRRDARPQLGAERSANGREARQGEFEERK